VIPVAVGDDGRVETRQLGEVERARGADGERAVAKGVLYEQVTDNGGLARLNQPAGVSQEGELHLSLLSEVLPNLD